MIKNLLNLFLPSLLIGSQIVMDTIIMKENKIKRDMAIMVKLVIKLVKLVKLK